MGYTGLIDPSLGESCLKLTNPVISLSEPALPLAGQVGVAAPDPGNGVILVRQCDGWRPNWVRAVAGT
jgi:hypothetical protein